MMLCKVRTNKFNSVVQHDIGCTVWLRLKTALKSCHKSLIGIEQLQVFKVFIR